MMECEHEWHWFAGLNCGQWEACQRCGAGRDYVSKEPIAMHLTVWKPDPPDGRPDYSMWIPLASLVESGP